MKKYVLDIGVVVEYIVERSPQRTKVVNLFNAAARGEVQLFVTPIAHKRGRIRSFESVSSSWN